MCTCTEFCDNASASVHVHNTVTPVCLRGTCTELWHQIVCTVRLQNPMTSVLLQCTCTKLCDAFLTIVFRYDCNAVHLPAYTGGVDAVTSCSNIIFHHDIMYCASVTFCNVRLSIFNYNRCEFLLRIPKKKRQFGKWYRLLGSWIGRSLPATRTVLGPLARLRARKKTKVLWSFGNSRIV